MDIDGDGGGPLSVGDLVYWDGREFGCPIIDGEVIRTSQADSSWCWGGKTLLDVTVKGDG